MQKTSNYQQETQTDETIISYLTDAAPTLLIMTMLMAFILNGFVDFSFYKAVFLGLGEESATIVGVIVASFIEGVRFFSAIGTIRSYRTRNWNMVVFGVFISLAASGFVSVEANKVAAEFTHGQEQHYMALRNLLYFIVWLGVIIEFRIIFSQNEKIDTTPPLAQQTLLPFKNETKDEGSKQISPMQFSLPKLALRDESTKNTTVPPPNNSNGIHNANPTERTQIGFKIPAKQETTLLPRLESEFDTPENELDYLIKHKIHAYKSRNDITPQHKARVLKAALTRIKSILESTAIDDDKLLLRLNDAVAAANLKIQEVTK